MNLLINFHAHFDIKQMEQALKYLEFASFPDEYIFEIAFPFSALKALCSKIVNEKIRIGSNAVCSVDRDSFTESVAAKMLALAGAEFLLTGSPSERARDSIESIEKKLIDGIECQLAPFLCIGEMQKEHEEKRVKEVIATQLQDLSTHLKDDATLTVIYYSHWLQKPRFKPSLDEIKKTFQSVLTVVNQCLKESRFFLPYNPNFSVEQNWNLIQSCPSQGIFLDLVSQHHFERVLSFLQFLKKDKKKMAKVFRNPLKKKQNKNYP